MGMAEAMSCFAREETSFEVELGAAGHRKARQLYSWPAEKARLLMAIGTPLPTERNAR